MLFRSYWLVEIETGGARNEYGPVTAIGGPAGGMLVYVPLAVR